MGERFRGHARGEVTAPHMGKREGATRAWAVGCSPGDAASSVGECLEAYGYGLPGQGVLDQLGPLDEAEVTALEVFLAAHVVGFGEAAYAVEVEVIDGLALRRGVFIDDGKGGGGDGVLDAQCAADGLDEGGLAGSHRAVEGEDTLVAHRVDEGACG